MVLVLARTMKADRKIGIFVPTAAIGRWLAEELLKDSPVGHTPIYEPSKRKLTWPNGSTAQFFSILQPRSWRGAWFHFGWAVGVGDWRTESNLDTTLSEIQLTVRSPTEQFLVTY